MTLAVLTAIVAFLFLLAQGSNEIWSRVSDSTSPWPGSLFYASQGRYEGRNDDAAAVNAEAEGASSDVGGPIPCTCPDSRPAVALQVTFEQPVLEVSFGDVYIDGQEIIKRIDPRDFETETAPSPQDDLEEASLSSLDGLEQLAGEAWSRIDFGRLDRLTAKALFDTLCRRRASSPSQSRTEREQRRTERWTEVRSRPRPLSDEEVAEILEEQSALEAQIGALREEQAGLESEIARLEEERKALAIETESLEQKKRSAQFTTSALESEAANLESEIAEMQEEQAILAERMEVMLQEEATLSEGIRNLTAQEMLLVSEVDELQTLTSTLEAEDEALLASEVELMASIADLEAKQSSLLAATAAEEEEMAALDDEKLKLLEQKMILQADTASLTEEKEVLDAEVSVLREERALLQEAASLEDQIAELEKEASSLQAQTDAMKAELTALENSVEGLKVEAERIKAESDCTRLAKISEALTWFDEENAPFHAAMISVGSRGYSNYRHQADACHAYHLLVANGVPAENIVVLMYDDVAFDDHNPYLGQLFNRPGGEDVYRGCVIDYRGEDVNKNTFFAVLKGDADAVDGVGSGRVLNRNPAQKVFFYYSDHGSVGVLAMPTEVNVYADELQLAIKEIAEDGHFDEMLVYLEACNGGSMFQGFDLDGVLAVTAAGPDENSFATYCSSRSTEPVVPNASYIGSCLGDLFSVSWMEDTEASDLMEETVAAQLEMVAARTSNYGSYTSGSHVEHYGDNSGSILTEIIGNYQSYCFAPPGMKLSDVEQITPSNERAYTRRPEESEKPHYRQRDADLVFLRHKAREKADPYYQRELDREVRRRSRIDAVVRGVIQDLIDRRLLSEKLSVEAMATTLVFDREGRQVVDDWDCLRAMVRAFEENCMALDDYSRQYTRTFVNLCNAGLDADKAASSMKRACHPQAS